jgi:hypothetical protein
MDNFRSSVVRYALSGLLTHRQEETMISVILCGKKLLQKRQSPTNLLISPPSACVKNKIKWAIKNLFFAPMQTIDFSALPGEE